MAHSGKKVSFNQQETVKGPGQHYRRRHETQPGLVALDSGYTRNRVDNKTGETEKHVG